MLTVDPALGDIEGGDVLIEGDTIAQVGKDLSADAEVIDATGSVVIPGFIDTHRHTWEAAIRSCAPDATLDDYFVEVLDSFAPLYRPEDVYASNLAGALECINAGITTLVDWSHINNTPDHPDAAIQGLQGVRHPLALRVRQREHVAGRLLVQQLDRDPARGRRADQEHVLLLRRRPADDGSGHARPRLLPGRRGARRVGHGPRPRHPDHGAHRDGQAGRQVEHGQAARRPRPARAPTPRTSTPATSATRSGSWSRRARARSRSPRRWRCRWATAGRRS